MGTKTTIVTRTVAHLAMLLFWQPFNSVTDLASRPSYLVKMKARSPSLCSEVRAGRFGFSPLAPGFFFELLFHFCPSI